MAVGGFVTRAFESMLKECSSKKYPDLQSAIQNYKESAKDPDKVTDSTETTQTASSSGEQRVPHVDEVVEDVGRQVGVSGTITTSLANAGHTLEEGEAKLILNPLRLAFETKNVKILELALDCLHKLIAYDHLEGDPGIDGGKNGSLFTDILNMVCSSVDNSSLDSTVLQVLKVLLTAIASTKFRVHGEPLLGVIKVCYNIALNSKSPINQATSKAMLTQMISIIFKRMETDTVYCSSSGFTPQSETSSDNHSTESIEDPVSGDQKNKETNTENAFSPNQDKDTVLASIEEVQNLAGGADIKGLEAVLGKAVQLENGEKSSRGMGLEGMSIGHRDALLLFRTLCNMCMKEDNDEFTTKTRILSLELLQGLLECVSFSFPKNLRFIDSVKAHLSYALLRATVSQSPVIFQHAAEIFLILLLQFRESLKGEIGVFFPLIVLRPLDGSDLNQKLSVLRILEKICKDPQMLVDLYVNYDCDLEAPNLFERMVKTLCKMGQGQQSVDPKSVTASQMASAKGLSLQCLVNMLKSLVDWENSWRDSEKQNKGKLSCEEDVSTRESNELKGRDELPNNFEKVKAQKTTMQTGISEFNRKPMKGVEFLISNGLVENKAASVAQFLKTTPSLDKAMIGDYLGQHENFPLSVMHAYVDSMKFSGMKFDSAIRELLKGFRLPGEAQKIDRIMEKFAERYCADTPGLFKSADTAYVLAYAVIMLNTDAHNPMVWPKMSKTDFIRMNVTNDAEDCAPEELLEEIYDSIIEEEIKMKDENADLVKGSKLRREAEEKGRLISILNLALPRSITSTDAKSESEAIVKQTQAIFRNQGSKRGVFYTSHQIELVRPMVEALGWPLLATFSVTMEEGENKSRVVICMEGFRAGIHITHVLGMDTMRYAFLTSLVRFNFLHSPRDMRSKNVEALRALLDLCASETEALQDSWLAILSCISRLDYCVSSPTMSALVMQGSNQISRDAILQSLRDLSGKPAEQVFVNSLKLSSESVVEFFTALCNVSAEELKQTPARVFSLQKLVEISYYNMARIRMVWARIWTVLSNHFIFAGSHHEERIAMYAIDSLKQLGMKYLERAELANFTFQNDILKPFVFLMRKSGSESRRRLIVDCIVQMIKSKVASIKSGWRSVFMIFTAAAIDGVELIVESAFENVEQVVLEHFDQVVGDCFMDCVNCLIGFANNKSSHRISLKAIALLRICEDRLAEGRIPGGALKPVDIEPDATYNITEHYWFPMLAGLSDLTSDPRAEVRDCALEVLFDLLNERGSKFSTPFWESIFYRVLFPIFDHVRHAGKENTISSEDNWLRETSIHSLQLLCNLFNTFYKEVCFMLSPLLGLLLDCSKQTDQSVVSISLGALVHLIEVGGHQFSESDWDTLLKSIRDATYTTLPLELLNAGDFKKPYNQVLSRDLGDPMIDNSSPRTIDDGAQDKSQRNVSDGGASKQASVNIDANGTARNHSVSAVVDLNQEVEHHMDQDGSESLTSPSESSQKSTHAGGFQRSQTIGQRIMGNMMDNVFVRSFTSKSKNHSPDIAVPSSPSKIPDVVDHEEAEDEDESPLLQTIRSKCITQLLLLGAIDSIQKRYWLKLKAQQKVEVMDILFSMLEFASTYDSYTNLKLRMHHILTERPPLNLLRQELVGTRIYLEILQKTAAGSNFEQKEQDEKSPHDVDDTSTINDAGSAKDAKEEKLLDIAEEKLVLFCAQILREATDFQSSVETTNMDIHQVLELRSPIIVKVLKDMCFMNSQIFKKHLKEFYPLITKLVCSDQMDVRGALADLFKIQLNALLPQENFVALP